RVQLRRRLGRQGHANRQREGEEAGTEGAQALLGLKEEGDEEERPHDARITDEKNGVHPAEKLVAEEADVEHRLSRPELDDCEGGQQGDAGKTKEEHAAVTKAMLPRLGKAINDRHEAGAGKDEACQVEPAGALLLLLAE